MKPINKHVLIEPIESTDFVKSATGQYQEIGRVVEVADGVDLPVGAVVYFDSWLAKKYLVKDSIDKFIWFVNYDDLVAYEEIPK